jgi:hypothetical protein
MRGRAGRGGPSSRSGRGRPRQRSAERPGGTACRCSGWAPGPRRSCTGQHAVPPGVPTSGLMGPSSCSVRRLVGRQTGRQAGRQLPSCGLPPRSPPPRWQTTPVQAPSDAAAAAAPVTRQRAPTGPAEHLPAAAACRAREPPQPQELPGQEERRQEALAGRQGVQAASWVAPAGAAAAAGGPLAACQPPQAPCVHWSGSNSYPKLVVCWERGGSKHAGLVYMYVCMYM